MAVVAVAKTNFYVQVLRTDPDYATIITNCTTKHQAEAPGHNLSVVQFSNGTDLIKVKNGDATWKNSQSWAASVISHFINTDIHDSIRVLIADAYSSEPGAIPNLEYWFDAAVSDFVVHTDNVISQLTDKSGNSRHAVQSTELLKPTWDEGSGGAVFDGVNTLMTASTAAAAKFLHETDHTVFVVFKITDANPGNAQELVTTYNTSGVLVGYNLSFTDVTAANDTVVCRIGNGGGSNIISLLESNDAFPAQTKGLVVTSWEYNISGDDFQFYIGSTAGGTANTNAAPSSSNPVTALTLGGSGVVNSLKGTLFEVLIYSRRLNTDERESVVGYLNGKWFQ